MGLGGLRRLLGDQQPYLTSGPSWGSGRHGWRRKWHGFLTRGSWRCPWSADESSALKGALNGDESSPLHAHSVSDVFITPDGVNPELRTLGQSPEAIHEPILLPPILLPILFCFGPGFGHADLNLVPTRTGYKPVTLSHRSTTANPSSNPFFCHPFFCQSSPVSDPDLNMPTPFLLRPAQVKNPCHFSIAQQRLIHC